MKFAISCLILICPAFPYWPSFFTDTTLGLPDHSFLKRGVPIAASGTLPDPQNSTHLGTHALIHRAATRHGISVALVKSIVAAESNFNRDAISTRGAIGLMQLMPDTARQYGADASVPEQNVDAGAHYLRDLMDKYSKYRNPLPRVIAAYNAGPRMVDRYHGVPPFRETRRYVFRVLHFLCLFQLKAANGDPATTRNFFESAHAN